MTFPLRGNGLAGQVVDSSSGRGKVAARLDSTGTDSARILASALMTGVTPANSRWFQLDVGNESAEERRWLDEAGDIVWENIHASNFDAAGFECCLDVVAAGWFVLFTDINRTNGGGYAFEQWPIAQCFIASTRQDARVDTIYREYSLTAQQAVAEFGADSLSPEVNKLALEKPFEMVQFLRVIEPRQVYAVDAKLAKNLPFKSCDIEIKGKHQVREQGFHEFPCSIPRWTLLPNSCYAVGPAFDALPDMLELMDLLRMEKAAADLAVSGMWIAEDDGVLNPRGLKVGPRKIIVAASVDSMKELKSGADFNVSFTLKSQLQAQIRQLLGPVYGRMQSEYLQTLIERCFGLALRAGALGQPPSSLANRDYHVKYISPLARAQRGEDVAAMDRLESTIIAKSEAMPDLLDTYDWEEADRLRGQYLGVPGKLMRTPEAVADLRNARAQAQQQAAQQQQTMQAAEAVAANSDQAQVMGALMAA